MYGKILAAIVSIGILSIVTASAGQAATLTDCTGLPKDQCASLTENSLNYKGKNVVWDIVKFILMLLGSLAVIMIIVGGIQYAISQGDAGAVSKAKNTILYAVIGLIVALLASGIVTLIVSNISK